jgi:hypothetical protein
MENETEIEKLAGMVQRGFAEVHERFGGIAGRFGGVEERLGILDETVGRWKSTWVSWTKRLIRSRPSSTRIDRRQRTASPPFIAP